MSLTPAAREHLLAFADDEHIVGARHTNWIGLGPFLEEDLAFCSIAQDELGHAIGLYELLLDDAGTDRAELDTFALQRPANEYRSCWLAEIECSDWCDSLVRHWLYDRAEALRWSSLEACGHAGIESLARRAQREEGFHLAHAEQFMSRIAASEHAPRLVGSINTLLPIADGVFDPVESEPDLLDEGFLTLSSDDLAASWRRQLEADLQRWGLDIVIGSNNIGSNSDQAVRQQRRTQRSAGFAALQADLVTVIELDPAAVW